MGLQFDITQERRLLPLQHRVYKTTKNMAPTRNTYSLRSKGLPPKVAGNKELDAIEVQVPPKAAVDTSQPLIAALTLQVTQLSTALEEQRMEFTRQYEALQTELTLRPRLQHRLVHSYLMSMSQPQQLAARMLQ